MTIDIPVQSGIPIPPRNPGPRKGAKRRWPFRKMDYYDSFLLLTEFPERESRLAYVAAKRLGVRIVIRCREGGIRVWKVPEEPASLDEDLIK